MNEQELNKKLAERASLPHPNHTGELQQGKEYRVDQARWIETPLLTQSLDACFQWIVPDNYFVSFERIKNGEIEVCLQHKKLKLYGHNNTRALALCLAIEKLIDGEK